MTQATVTDKLVTFEFKGCTIQIECRTATTANEVASKLQAIRRPTEDKLVTLCTEVGDCWFLT